MVLGRSPRDALALALATLPALVLLAGSFAFTGDPLPLLAVSLAAAAGAFAVHMWGAEAPLLGAIVVTPLIPNTTEGFLTGALGAHGGDIRAALIIGLIGAYVACFPRGMPRLPRRLAAVAGSLLVVAGAGLAAAAANSVGPGSLLAEISHGTGQPLIYALLIAAVIACLRTREGARERLLAAICVGMLGEAAIVAYEIGTGAAYDAYRGITRAQGTVGANFLSAMAMLGFFAGLSLRSGTRDPWLRSIGGLTAVATLGILAVATTRGGLAGVVLGGAYILLSGSSARTRVAVLASGTAVLLALVAIPPVSALWSERLDVRGGITGFDRVSTWISGALMGADAPLTGLGAAGVAEGVATNPRYSETPAGHTSVVPHNIWILAFAEGGVPGLLATLAFTFLAALAVVRRPRPPSAPDRILVGGLIALAAVCVVNNLLTHPEVMIPGFILLAIVAGPAPAARERGGSRSA